MHDQEFTRGSGQPTVQGVPGTLVLDVPRGAGGAVAATRECAAEVIAHGGSADERRRDDGASFAASDVTEITHVTTKQDLARWTRAHEGVSGITWSVFAGEGGTMVIVEHGGHDRAAAVGAGVPVPVPVLAGAGAL
jgi:hypothetical protein